jgi:calcineurin-like phosphoesterase
MIGCEILTKGLTYIGDVGMLGPIGMRHVALDL